MDAGHVILAAAVVIVVVARIRAARHRDLHVRVDWTGDRRTLSHSAPTVTAMSNDPVDPEHVDPDDVPANPDDDDDDE